MAVTTITLRKLMRLMIYGSLLDMRFLEIE